MKHVTSRHWMVKGLLALTLLVGFTAGAAEASITLAWNPTTTNVDGTPCTDLAGYLIYYATGSSGTYNGTGLDQGDSPIVVSVSSLSDPANPESTLTGLDPDKVYHFAVTASDANLNESNYSNEVTSSPLTSAVTSSGGGGGGGCALSREPESMPDLIWLLLPVALAIFLGKSVCLKRR